MADKYKFLGSKTPGQRVGRIKLGDRVLVKDGPPVELSEEEVERYRARGYILHKSSSGSSAPKQEKEPKEAKSEKTDNPSDKDTETSGKEV